VGKALKGQGLADRRDSGGIIIRAVVQGRGHKNSCAVLGSVGRIKALASRGQNITQVNSIDK